MLAGSLDKFLATVCLAIGFIGCSPGSLSVGDQHAADFVNGGFETGSAGATPPAPWAVTTYLNSTGVTIASPETRSDLNLAVGGKNLTTIVSGSNTADPDLGTGASLRYPRYGSQCARVNFHSSSTYGNATNVNSLAQTMTVTSSDVDPTDGLIHIRFVMAPVLQNPGHTPAQQPYYFVQVTNVTKSNAILYSDFNLSAQAGVPWKTVNGGTTNEIDYLDWTLVDIAPGATQLAIGDSVKLEIIASGCQPGGHFGEIYVDGIGTSIPGLFIHGSGPTRANAGTNITYTLSYKNGSSAGETGVTIDFTTPPNTTFQSLTPPAGATCTTPPVGGAGAIVCTFGGTVAAGATGSFNVTVAIAGGSTGQITCGNYDIKSTQETALTGNKIVTAIGCAQDSDCPAGNWCNESGNACTPALGNGTSMPSDPPHTNPTLNGVCTTTAATLVCTSAVCDTSDNKCGFANGDGTCTTMNAATVCRSGACDPDGKCGYANGDGPCTSMNGGTVCRSGACSANNACMPSGGCNVDSDCAAGKWCNETTHACMPTLANGIAVATDPAHTNPTLDGMCTVAAGALVCTSAVCDTVDNECGYANGDGMCSSTNAAKVCRSAVCDPDGQCGYAVGDGPCTATSAGTVCRSATCSTNGLCEPAGGCNVDADCTGGTWCDESVHACTPKLANGTLVPTDPPHTSPTLNGTCTTAAATLTCQSGVCDTSDNQCGYAVGDGPCSGNAQCRSGLCSANGTCAPAGGCNVDADCSGGNWCNESMHACTPKLANGTSLPNDPPHTSPTLNAMCTTAAATLTCVSGVCDAADDKCGFANGDGACTSGNATTVCRSGVCDPDGKCGFANSDGPCTQSNGGTVCRSGVCSSNGTCEAAGACNVDADCAAGKWCDESMHSCTDPLPNGSPLPNDPPHASPTLNGMCTPDAAMLTCQSGVCDSDNECGFADGDGPCSGGTVCRSGFCSANGTCGPAGGCNVDADCAGGKWCDETMHVCSDKLANGTPVPTDAPHMSPTLNGRCTSAAAMLTCQSGVCDMSDDACGYADGDGSCDPSNGDVVCRSGVCGTNGTCGATEIVGCMTDADCATASAPVCDPSAHMCVPRQAMPRYAFAGGGFCAVGGAASGTPSLAILFLLSLSCLLVRARSRNS